MLEQPLDIMAKIFGKFEEEKKKIKPKIFVPKVENKSNKTLYSLEEKFGEYGKSVDVEIEGG